MFYLQLHVMQNWNLFSRLHIVSGEEQRNVCSVFLPIVSPHHAAWTEITPTDDVTAVECSYQQKTDPYDVNHQSFAASTWKHVEAQRPLSCFFTRRLEVRETGHM